MSCDPRAYGGGREGCNCSLPREAFELAKCGPPSKRCEGARNRRGEVFLGIRLANELNLDLTIIVCKRAPVIIASQIEISAAAGNEGTSLAKIKRIAQSVLIQQDADKPTGALLI